MICQEIAFFDEEGHSSGALTSMLSGDPTALQELLGLNFGILLASGCTLIGCILLGFIVSWRFAIVITFAAIPLILAAMIFRVRVEVQFDKMTAAVYADSAQFASEAVGAIRTVSSL